MSRTFIQFPPFVSSQSLIFRVKTRKVTILNRNMSRLLEYLSSANFQYFGANFGFLGANFGRALLSRSTPGRLILGPSLNYVKIVRCHL